MNKKTWIAIGVIILAFVGVVALSWTSRGRTRVQPVNYDDYNIEAIIPADQQSGNIPEHVIGSVDAPVLIFEYADYQCEACALFNPYFNQLVEEYQGKVAVVYRGYVISYHQNGTAAASAANAAGLQGYWYEYKNQLFTNQNEWYSASASARQSLFEEYFVQATGGKGDLAKFRKDMASVDVAQKIEFDRGLAELVGLDWTPSIWVGGELVPREEMNANDFMTNMRKRINAILAEQN